MGGVDLGGGRSCRVVQYGAMSRAFGDHHPRSWKLQGANDSNQTNDNGDAYAKDNGGDKSNSGGIDGGRVAGAGNSTGWEGKQWHTLCKHRDDDAMEGSGACAIWQVKDKSNKQTGSQNSEDVGGNTDGFYRYFRVVSTGADSGGLHYLAFSCIELYGELKEGTGV